MTCDRLSSRDRATVNARDHKPSGMRTLRSVVPRGMSDDSRQELVADLTTVRVVVRAHRRNGGIGVCVLHDPRRTVLDRVQRDRAACTESVILVCAVDLGHDLASRFGVGTSVPTPVGTSQELRRAA
jgi:hypothetical protein